MDPQTMIVAIVAMACLTGLIKTWINRDKSNNGIDEEDFDRLARAFIQHKKEMKKRVQNLEAIAVDQDEEGTSFSQIETSQNEGTLTNDLKKNKDRVRS